MTVQNLIELSILDAMGLLDEDERLAFESAFRTASPAIQAHVRREQTRLSRIESLLPEVEPPAGLRALVLEAVRAHIAGSATASIDDDLPALVLPIGGRRGVSALWRAGALGLAAAVLMLSITTFMVQSEYRSLTERLGGDQFVAELSRSLGPKFMHEVLFNRDTERVVLTPVASGFKGEASLFVNPEWKNEAQFFCRAIATPPGQQYKIAILDEGGNIVQVLKEFSSAGELLPIVVEIKPGTSGDVAVLQAGTVGTRASEEAILIRGQIPGPAKSM
jgi:hypothetical protein